MATALYPGSFDPIHLGHLDIVEQAVELFERVIVVVMHNHEKKASTGMFAVDERIELVRRSIDASVVASDRVEVTAHGGLAIDAAASTGADLIVKGLRSAADFEIEQQMALTNYSVTGIRTVYLPCAADRGFISSRFVREIARYGGSVDHMVPGPVAEALGRPFLDDTTR